MTFDVRVVHTVEEVGQEPWDRLSGDRPFASYRWYRYGEIVLNDNWPIYVILSRHGQQVARATFWLRRREQLPIPSSIVRSLCDLVLRRWPLLVCQSPLVEAPGLILPQDRTLAAAAAREIHQTIDRYARRKRVSFWMYDYLGTEEVRHTPWPPAASVVDVGNPGTSLSVQPVGVEDYIRQLGKSAWKDYRRKRNQARKSAIEVTCRSLERPLEDQVIEKAVEKIWRVDRKHDATPTPWARRMLRHAPMVNAAWLTARIDGRLVGCGMLVGDGGVRKMALLGRDPHVRHVYFPMIYAAIQCAVDEGICHLWGGSGSYEAKRRLGFQLLNNSFVVFAGRGPLFHRIGRVAAGRSEGYGR